MRKSGSHVLVLSALLAMSLLGCESCDKEEGGIQKSKTMLEWERNIERAKAGFPIDFDGDGFEEYLQRTDESGIIHVEIKSPDGNFYFLSELHPNEPQITFYDKDGDGVFGEKIEEKTNSRIYLLDTDGDGVFDERIIVTYDVESNESLRVFEVLQLDGSWKER
jgi:hypothetical protein